MIIDRPRRFGRIVLVTLGLMLAGAVFGAIAGGAALQLVFLISGDPLTVDAFVIGGFFGAPLGAITAPLLSWLLLRRVSLGRMFLVCSCGAAIGGVVGWFLIGLRWDLVGPLAGAFVGCALSALILSSRTRASPVAAVRG